MEQVKSQLEVANEQRMFELERSNVLSDMISLQACVMELLRRHWSWMYDLAPEATAAEPASTSQPADSCSSGQSTLHQNQYKQGQHNCMRQLLAATPQQLQRALTMTPQDWVEMGRCHFRELSVLLEFVNRPQETYRDDPAAFDAAATAAASLASVFFGADSSTATSAGEEADTAGTKTAAAAAAAAGSVAPAEQQQPEGEADAVAAVAAAVDGNLPWDRDPMRLLCDALARTSMMCHLGLMHACMNFFYAGSLNMETMQPETPSPRFWRGVVERLHLSPTQQLHFRVAVQEYRRLTRAGSAAGLDLVQNMQHFSLSDVAARFIAEGQPPTAAAAAGEAEPAAAAAAGAAATSAGGGSDAAAAAGDDDAAAGSPLQQLDAKLQRHWLSYFCNIQLVNAFIMNSVTPYQHALMWIASYPYFPIPGSIAEALDAVPATGDPLPLPPHIQAHISSSAERHIARRSALMAQQKQELRWWEQQ
ncbi:hypothetical protein OEZ86_003303 [Tetradesmus obliquus]|nr:hypothetical protein OEZ86_003303 [Tetradesmus obliquus]